MMPTPSPEVATVFAGYPPRVRDRVLALRELIFETAASTDGVGEIDETLKWGEPAYLTSETKSGTTIRLNWKASTADRYRMLFHCQTNLIETFRSEFPNHLEFEGHRSIVFDVHRPVPEEPLRICIAQALTYHRNKRRSDS